MSPPSDPAVVIILNAAWHLGESYSVLADRLRTAGITTVETPTFPSTGRTDSVATATLADDTAMAVKTMQPHLDAGREIVVVFHSYAGLPGVDAVVGNTVSERKTKGLTGGVKTVIWVSAWAPTWKGVGFLEAFIGGGDPPDFFEVKDSVGTLTSKAVDRLYNGVDSATADKLFKNTVKQGSLGMSMPNQHSAAEVDTEKVYMLLEQDRAIPPEVQENMAKACGAEIVRLDAGHVSPFVVEGSPEMAKLVAIVKQKAGL